MAAIASMHGALFTIYLLLHPHFIVRGPCGFLVNGSLGHFLTLPALTILCLLSAVRCAIVALGPAKAIVTDGEGATVNTIWRSHRIGWSDLLSVRVETKRFRRTTYYLLKFDRCTGGSVSLPLAGVDLPKERRAYEDLARTLSNAHLSTIQRRAEVSADTVSSVSPEATFPHSSLTARPVFGRKTA